MRDTFRDNYNPYRDERRGGTDRFRGDRSLSPRPGSRDYTSGAPSYGGGRSPIRRTTGTDDNSEIVPIEKNLVGLIIGRAGENLRRVENVTGARVQFMDGPETNSSSRHCKISGSRAAVASAKAEIYKVIDDNEVAKRGQAAPRARGSQQPAAPPSDGDSEQILVPDRTVGLIIGRGGETIRDLQERSGCHVNIVGENKSVNGFRPVNLIGTAQQQQRAKDLIYEIVESDTKTGGGKTEVPPARNDPFSGQGNFKDSIMVPGEAVGMIIGKGGESIKEMQNLTGCKINVSQASGRDIEREIGLVANNRQAIDAAKRAIMEKVDAVEQRNRAGGGGGRDDRDSYAGDRYSNQQPAAFYPPAGMPQVPQQQAQAPGGADPYAPYGGYQAYVAMWYAAMQHQQQQQPGGPPPGEQR
jgi:far upstream element-binding protein